MRKSTQSAGGKSGRSPFFLVLILFFSGLNVWGQDLKSGNLNDSFLSRPAVRVFVGIDAPQIGFEVSSKVKDFFGISTRADFPLKPNARLNSKSWQGSVFPEFISSDSISLAPEVGIRWNASKLFIPVGMRLGFPVSGLDLRLQSFVLFGSDKFTQETHFQWEYFLNRGIHYQSAFGMELIFFSQAASQTDFGASHFGVAFLATSQF